MRKPPTLLTKADYVTGILLFLLGIYMVVEGLRMPGAGGYIEAGGEPGRVPVMLGVIIALLALVLLIRSVKAGGHRLLQSQEDNGGESLGLLRGLATMGWCSFYALAMLSLGYNDWQLSYHWATAIFLFVFILGFEWRDAQELGALRWRWLESRFPLVSGRLRPLSRRLSGTAAAHLWLIFTAALQAGLVTWAIAYLFESKFYVQLP